MKRMFRRAGGALVAACLLAPLAVGTTRGDQPAQDPAKTPQASDPRFPGDVDGVLLVDGRQIVGEFEEMAHQRWVIRPKAGGEPMNVSVLDIVVAETGGEIEQRGAESAAAAIWRKAIRAAYCDALESAVRADADASLVDQARKLLAAMQQNGADESRTKPLGALLEGKTQNPDAAAQQQAAAREEAATASRIAALEKGAAWCAKRGFVAAATSFENEIETLDSKRAADVEARAKALMPASFFFKSAPDAVAKWRKWADALLPSSAEFVDKEDESWGRLENEPWTDGATLCFRTANVLLFIRDMDPAVCGRALLLAESTVRGLQVFLNEGEPDIVTGDASRLEIRIHKNREDYLAEKPKRGPAAEPWTAGFFSPFDGASHFYVDHRRAGVADMEELTRVLTHEFTHHYISRRWIPRIITAQGAGEQPGGPGVWVVEGMAEFVQNQFRRDPTQTRFDDDTALGNDATAQARKSGIKLRYARLDTFMDASRCAFDSLSDDPTGVVKLRHSPGMHGVSERGFWYDQAGTLCYFFLQKKGLEMRKKFVKYVSDHYAGNPHVPAWTYLGYPSADALEADFDAFMKSIGG